MLADALNNAIIRATTAPGPRMLDRIRSALSWRVLLWYGFGPLVRWCAGPVDK
jgi:hypothetical protein